jgi:Tfp pilus assembly protein PilN
MKVRAVAVLCAVLSAVLCCLLLLPASLRAQNPDAKALVTEAERVELQADHVDHSAYVYLDHDVTPDQDTLSLLVETPQGSLKRKLEDHGHPLTREQRQQDDQRIETFLADPAAQQRAKRDSAHDDDQAEQMLKLLPTAFLWTFVKQEGDLATLAFRPDPNFEPRTLEARVLSAMGGQVVVDRSQNRIYAIRGSLLADVKFGFGILGRLQQGGTFEVERREIAPHHWQMVSSRVHITGHALLFKTIGQQEDDTHTDFKPSPCQTLQQAWEYLKHQPS